MNKLQRQQLQQKHQPYNGWTHFTPKQQPVSYRTKQQQRDELKLEKEWK